MSIASVFRDAAESFNGQPFGKEELRRRFYQLRGFEDKRHFDDYFKDFARGTANKYFKLTPTAGGYVVIKTTRTRTATSARRSTTHSIRTPRATFTRDHGVFSSTDDALRFLIFLIKEWDRYFGTIGAIGVPPTGSLRYLQPTDNVLLSSAGLTNTQYIYKELALHAQNSPLSNSVKFLLQDPVGTYPRQEFINRITGDFGARIGASILHNPTALHSAFSSAGIRKNSQWDKYIAVLQDIEAYLYPHGSASKTTADVIRDFSPSAGTTMTDKSKEICRKFNRYFPRGFKVALTLDFLKEFDSSFDYPKPDTHVKRIIYYLYQTSPVLTKEPEKIMDEFSTIELIEELYNKAKASYIAHGGTGHLTVFLIDKIIYLLCCKSPLYLPGEPSVSQSITKKHREDFINAVIRKDYLSEVVNKASIELIDRHL